MSSTAALNGDFFLQAVDATSVSSRFAELKEVYHTSASYAPCW